MNLTKEQLQKAGLGAVLVLVALYAYFSMLLGPLGAREARAKKVMTDLAPKIKEANSQITRTKSVETGDPLAEAATIVREAMTTKIPDGAPIVWLPQRLSSFFLKNGVEKIFSKPDTEAQDASLPDYRLSSWTVTVPEVEFNTFASALAAFENEEGLAQITFLKLEARPTNVQSQGAILKFTTVVKK
jgi:hypothetical protein